ncbi:cold shock domain-containing protein [Goodfellowiella coeruleoviolacea]|uniref:Cold shock protein (Beta-ribbon, CspA family) n=1 Tax=Goodfellowiella coeruleoviolacea TaxID=334858 RepID=A0AAE3GFW7_9PSEU|nr:cold shock domain-containing protein [Goodfellowiella coeruleoviolacea]MCP2167507.1 cold shock protein (beta-ribbon, CspA family) [Goodfellowiella coeruleoviolacea]
MTGQRDPVHRGRVREWHVDEGWGVVESPAVDSPIWTHYSGIDPASPGLGPGGFRLLRAGEEVEVRVERAEQDGYHWRATWVRQRPTRSRGGRARR